MSSSDDGAASPSYKVVDRRAMLRSVGLAGGLVAASTVLAACGSKSSNGSTATGGAAKAVGGAVAKSKVPVGSGIIDNSLQSVITQPTSGEFKAFNYLCTHQGCPVSQISGDKIMCACHGSEFSIKDGSVLRGPATKPLAPRTATVKGSQVVVS
jgi:Rieske Fe-S protein